MELTTSAIFQGLIAFSFALFFSELGKALIRISKIQIRQLEGGHRLENFYLKASVQFVLGFAIWGLFGQVIAQFGWFSPKFILISAAPVIIWGLWTARLAWKFQKIPIEKSPENLCLALIIFLMLVFFVLTFSPPGTDALAYYLTQSKLISFTHALVTVPTYEPFIQNGLGAEVILAALISIGGILAAKNFVWYVAFASLGLIYGITRQMGGSRRAGIFSVAILLTSTAFTLVMWDGKTDLFAHAVALLTFTVCLSLPDLSERKNLALIGALWSLSIFYKLSYLPDMTVALFIFLIYTYRDLLASKEFSKLAKKAALVLLAFLVIFAVNSMKNWYLFGEPLAPFFFLKKGPEGFNLDQVWFNAENTGWIVKTYPLALVFGQYPMQHGNFSPLWLVLLPLGFFVRPEGLPSKSSLALFLSAAAGLITWVLLRPSVLAPRYFLIVGSLMYPHLAICATQLPAMFQNKVYKKGMRWILYLVVAGVLYSQIALWKGHTAEAIRYAVLQDKKWDDPIWQTLRLADENRQPGEKIAMFYYYRSPLSPQSLLCLSTRADLRSILRKDDSLSIWEKLYNEGYSSVVIDTLSFKSIFEDAVKGEKNIHNFDEPAPEWMEVEKHQMEQERYSVTTIKSKRPSEARKQCLFNEKIL